MMSALARATPSISKVGDGLENQGILLGNAIESFGYKCGKDGVSVISFDATYNALVYCQKGKIAMTVECNPLLGPLVESVIRTIEEGKVPEKNRYVEETAFLPEDITDELLSSRKY